MWLLNTINFKLHNFLNNIPEYVILSHTWGDGEVTFGDFDKPYARDMPGFRKIVDFCTLAIRDGYEWGWVDTCCIDKRSSAELSEAINSMYRYYWQAAVCYAYLADFDSSLYRLGLTALKSSRWFTRGWTLQELLAPDIVEFYNAKWEPLGTKSSLVTALAAATKIEEKYLKNRANIKDASIGTRFSWAALRETTRVEDLAYCMLGLVDINMPMLYGEGPRAFYRLQLEIIRKTSEHSIFAWEPVQAVQKDWQLTTVLAPSPSFFQNAAHIKLVEQAKFQEATTHEVTNNGLRITLQSISVGSDRVIGMLNCRDSLGARLGVWLERLGEGMYRRLSGSRLVTLSEEEEHDAVPLNMFLPVEGTREETMKTLLDEMTISEVQTDRICLLNGIAVSTWTGTTMVKDTYDRDTPVQENYLQSQNQFHYLQNELIIRNGAAACFQLGYARSKAHYEIFQWISVVCGLYKCRPLLQIVTDGDGFNTHWSEDMSTDISGTWDTASDFVQSWFGDNRILRAQAKKRHSNGRIQWSLSVEIHACSYRAPDNLDASCGCDRRALKSAFLGASGLMLPCSTRCRKREMRERYCPGRACMARIPEQLRQALRCTCSACSQHNMNQARYHKRLCDGCKQLLDKRSGEHYIECPCSACGRESKIEAEQIFTAGPNAEHCIECHCRICRQESKIEVSIRVKNWAELQLQARLWQVLEELRRSRSAPELQPPSANVVEPGRGISSMRRYSA
jgi:hypothetical protein